MTPTPAQQVRALIEQLDGAIRSGSFDLNDLGDDWTLQTLMQSRDHLRAYADLLDRTGWQPIETAPKDGREVILRVETRAGIPGCQLVGHFMQGGHCIEDHPPIDPGWYFWNGCMFDLAAKPTHWMPLPEPPQ